jgi:hypothetical protein
MRSPARDKSPPDPARPLCTTSTSEPGQVGRVMVMAVGVTLRSIATDTWPPGTGMTSWKKLL